MRRLLTSAIASAAAAESSACGGGSGDSEGGTGAPSGGAALNATSSVEIYALSLKFDKNALVLPAKADLTVGLSNRDAGVLSNVAIYKNKNGTGKVFAGELFSGSRSESTASRRPRPGATTSAAMRTRR